MHSTSDLSDPVHSFRLGIRDGIPIGLGYFAVAFSLGIAAKRAGLDALQGFLASLLTSASAGEYAVFSLIAVQASYAEVALMTLIANGRYLLMSCALAQRLPESIGTAPRLMMGAYITDEIFGITIAQKDPIRPPYTYGAILAAVPLWALGTSLGIIMGSLLPARYVSALSVALYGMFLAVFIPPAKENKVIAGAVIASFLLSWSGQFLPGISALSEGNRVILLTVALSAVVALLFPVKEAEDHAQ